MKNRVAVNEMNSKTGSITLRDSVAFGVLDSILTGICFYLGFVIYKSLGSNLPIIGRIELLLLTLGMAFCYAFIFVYRRSYNSIRVISHKATLIDLSKNLALAYLLDLAMLFVMKDNSFMSFRAALGIGLVLSIPMLYAGRLASGAIKAGVEIREGKRRLVLAGISEESESGAPENARVGSPSETMRNYFSDEPIHGPDDFLDAIDILQEGKSRVIIHKATNSRLTQHETSTADR
jgi:hypothetical protein